MAVCLAAGFLTATINRLEAPSPVLFSDARGLCFVKSVPPNPQNPAGVTRVFRVLGEKDQLLHSFDWYSSGLALRCGYFGPRGSRGRITFSLVRMGRGWKSELGETPVAVTLAFYIGGKLMTEYSRMDIALLPRNRRIGPAGSWRGYWKSLGYGRSGNSTAFEICTIDGRTLLFDFTNGKGVRQGNSYSNRCERLDSKTSPNYRKIVTTYN